MAVHDTSQSSVEFLGFIRRQARELAAGYKAPKSLEQWQEQREALRQLLILSLIHISEPTRPY